MSPVRAGLRGALGALLLTAFGVSPVWAEAAPEPEPASPPAANAAAPAPDVERLRLGREIIDLGFPAEMREGMFLGSVDSMLGQVRKVQLAQFANAPAVKALLDEAIDGMIAQIKPIITRNIPMFMEAYAKAYAREFTREELSELRAFVATPTGRHFMARSTQILDDPDFKAANEAYLREVNPVMQNGQKALLDKLLTHFRDHPPQGGKTS